jgi:ssDNA-binding Zn-finger/Zn-ribbon topoisomerase 1
MAKRCPKCGKAELKVAADFSKTPKYRDSKYVCPNCGYKGVVVLDDGDFKGVDGALKSRWLRKRARYG